ncbi:iron ABC transporter permease [Pseudonocardiaceae bacterium YIM PH 21723]|nr:iron ABC transporter permease [Pseudonocardiaceae bacterium YIM PH 21723]
MPAVLVALCVALPLAAGLALSVGSVKLPLADVWAIIVNGIAPGAIEPWWPPVREAIIFDARMPRVVLAMVVGAALAVAGAVAQTATRNPLADPYLLGVSNGAGLAVVLLVVFGFGAGLFGTLTLPIAAFAGALLALAVAMVISGRGGSIVVLLLCGLAVGQTFGAVSSIILFGWAKGNQTEQVLFWLAGGFGDARWHMVAVPGVVLLLVSAGIMMAGRWIDLLHAGDDSAAALGVNPGALRMVLLLVVSLVAGASVAVAGGIGFVGLLVPHGARALVGAATRRLLPVAALLGALFLVLCDLLARSMAPPIEVPVGLITAAIGGPVFLYVLLRHRRRFG